MSDLDKSYLYIAKNKPYEFNRLFSALLVIEKSNRLIVWRVLEYIFCIYEILFKKYITNYSIWQCQVKISMILDFYNVNYDICKKRLYYKDVSKKKILSFVFNDIYQLVISKSILKRFGNIDIFNLKLEDLKSITLFYSRNNGFTGDINYFTVIQHLYYKTFSKTLT